MSATTIAAYRVTFTDGATAKLVRVRTMNVHEGYSKAVSYAGREWPKRMVASVTFLKFLPTS